MSNPVEKIRQILEALLASLVDCPQELRIDIVAGEQATVFEIHCSQTDRGKIIGKHGEMAKCLRYFVNALAAKNRIRLMLEIVD